MDSDSIFVQTPLDPKLYNELPDVDEQPKLTNDVLKSIGDLFVKYDMHNSFGIALLHRHYIMQSNEIMVHKGLICSPENTTEYPLGDLAGHSFFLHDGKFLAYEFETIPGDSPIPSEAFLIELKEHILAGGLEQMIALTRVDPNGQPLLEECGPGRSHICVPANDSSWFSDPAVDTLPRSEKDGATQTGPGLLPDATMMVWRPVADSEVESGSSKLSDAAMQTAWRPEGKTPLKLASLLPDATVDTVWTLERDDGSKVQLIVLKKCIQKPLGAGHITY
ncbi:hypothetical protein ANO11243_006840 [Dothideomycetidae sp. 11243]|nr:hypothetical protein ANO11243_006840 [fungal sp. No.11243]